MILQTFFTMCTDFVMRKRGFMCVCGLLGGNRNFGIVFNVLHDFQIVIESRCHLAFNWVLKVRLTYIVECTYIHTYIFFS